VALVLQKLADHDDLVVGLAVHKLRARGTTGTVTRSEAVRMKSGCSGRMMQTAVAARGHDHGCVK
jgi:hypothetical protein